MSDPLASEPSASTPSDQDMRLDSARAAQLLQNLASVRQRIASASAASSHSHRVRLVAVSKLKSAREILALHQPSLYRTEDKDNNSNTPQTTTDGSADAETIAPQVDFGENYAQELMEKAALLPRSIRWHMIGALQTNKCKNLAESVPNLWSVSSVDSAKKADALEKGRAAAAEKHCSHPSSSSPPPPKLRILIQVNTSGEAAKSGVPPSDALALYHHVRMHCPHLYVGGFMTIGAIARSAASADADENEDFTLLRDARDRVVREDAGERDEDGKGECEPQQEQQQQQQLELSMGMSADFEGAIAQGSDEVRVGTTIFGQRPARSEARVL